MKTWEMIKMLSENPKLRFKGKTYYSHDAIVFIDDDDALSWEIDDGKRKRFERLNSGTWILNQNWQLVRASVPVWEAVKALAEGKIVRCECGDNCRQGLGRGSCKFPYSGSVCQYAISKGTWYIEE